MCGQHLVYAVEMPGVCSISRAVAFPGPTQGKGGKVALNSIPGWGTDCKSSKQWAVCKGRTGSQTQGHALIQSEHKPTLSLSVVQKNVTNIRSFHRHLQFASAGRSRSTCLTLPVSHGAAPVPQRRPCLQQAAVSSKQGYQQWLFWSEAWVWKLPILQVGYSRALFYHYKLIL